MGKEYCAPAGCCYMAPQSCRILICAKSAKELQRGASLSNVRRQRDAVSNPVTSSFYSQCHCVRVASFWSGLVLYLPLSSDQTLTAHIESPGAVSPPLAKTKGRTMIALINLTRLPNAGLHDRITPKQELKTSRSTPHRTMATIGSKVSAHSGL
jgi:hypothetical protein